MQDRQLTADNGLQVRQGGTQVMQRPDCRPYPTLHPWQNVVAIGQKSQSGSTQTYNIQTPLVAT